MIGKEWVNKISKMSLDELNRFEHALITLDEWETFRKEFVGIGTIQYFISEEIKKRGDSE